MPERRPSSDSTEDKRNITIYNGFGEVVPEPSDDEDVIRSRVLLVGARRGGKTSIQQVLFDYVVPGRNFFVEMSSMLHKEKVNSIIPLEIWDCPGSIDTLSQIEAPMSSFSSIILVIDIQDTYKAETWLKTMIIPAYQENPGLLIDVFVHKADVYTEDYRFDTFRTIENRVVDDLADIANTAIPGPGGQMILLDLADLQISFHLTSVYDNSIHEAFSRVMQRLLTPTSLPSLEDLLNIFCSNSNSAKAFLFDIRTRIFVATDSSPVDSFRHSLCCEYLLMLKSFSPLYKSSVTNPMDHPRRTGIPSRPVSSSTSPSSLTPTATNHEPQSAITISPALLMANSKNSSPKQSVLPDIALASTDTAEFSKASGVVPEPSHRRLMYPSSATCLTPDITLIYHVMTEELALLAMLPTNTWNDKRGMVEYNVVFLREGIQEICAVEKEVRRVPRPSPVSEAKTKKR